MANFGSSENWKSEIKLFVRRVLVADEFDELMPKYLAWVRGVVDSDDLPLNVNREQLQQSKVMKVISKKLTRKVLEMLKKLAKGEQEEDEDEEEEKDEEKATEKTAYEKFYDEFKFFLNLGCYEDDASRSKIAKLLRFPSTWSEKQDNKKLVSLEEYVARMQEEQPAIYYMAGVKIKEMLREVNLEIYSKKGLDVLLLDDPLSENCFSKIYDFEGVKLRSIQKSGDLRINWSTEENERHKNLVTMYKPLTKWWEGHKEGAGVPLRKVEISRRLVSAPAAVTADEWGSSARQERMNKVSQDSQQQDQFSQNQKVLEINPDHPAIYDLLQKVKADPEDSEVEETANLIAQAAVLESNFDLEDPEKLVNSVFELLSLKHNIDPSADIVPIDVELPEEPKEESDDVDDEDGADESDESQETVDEEKPEL